MQFSSVLSAAALLAQAASALYLVEGEKPGFVATYRDQRIGFYEAPDTRPAMVALNETGYLESGQGLNIGFFDRGDGLWRFEASTNHSDGGRPVIRGPFFLVGNGRLVLKPRGELLAWYLCGKPGALEISLGSPLFQDHYNQSYEVCHTNVHIYVRP